MRISTAQMFNQSLNAILRHQSSLADTQLQIATGKRILRPSDNPAGAKQVLDLNESLQITRQFQTNADAVDSRLGIEDGVLDAVTNLMQRVRELAIQGNNSTLTAPDRAAIGRELEQRLQELVGLANTRDGKGEYLFSGFSTRTKPFVADAAGGFIYNGDQGQRMVQVAAEMQIGDSNPGSEVFQQILNGNGTFSTRENPANTGTGVIDPGTVVDRSAWIPDTYTITFTTAATYEVRDSGAGLVTSGTYVDGAAIGFNGVQTFITGVPAAGDDFTLSTSASQDMFTTVANTINALTTTSNTAVDTATRNNAVNRALTDIDQSLENVRQVRADVGARLNTVDSEREVNADLELLISGDLSTLENVDLVEVITRLNQQLGALQAAQQSFAQLQNLSLFNFL